jgi:hypothetical protein
MDLAILKIGIVSDMDHAAWPVEAFVTEQSMVDDGRKVELGDEIFIAGLFWPHTGKNKNVPIVRVGNVAALRGEPVVNSYGKPMDAYLIDSLSISGISGSPVFIDVVLAKQMHMGERRFMMGNYPAKFRLLGVVHGHFNSGDRSLDSRSKSVENLGINLGISMVMPSEAIMEAIAMFSKQEELEVKEVRDKERSIVVADRAPQTNTTFQVTSYGFEMPIPNKDKVMADLEKASRKKH